MRYLCGQKTSKKRWMMSILRVDLLVEKISGPTISGSSVRVDDHGPGILSF